MLRLWYASMSAATRGTFRVLLALVSAMALMLTVAPVPAAAQVPPAPGSVTGTIQDADGVGVSEADVYLDSPGGDSLHVVTGTGGTYAFAPSPARYILHASAAGHPDTYYPRVQDSTDASLIAVKELGAVVVDLTLADAVTLTGSITDSAGNPLPAEVFLYRKDLGQIWSKWANADGDYTFADLWPGQLSIRASLTGHSETWLGGAATEAGATWVTASGTKTLDTIVLPGKAPITVAGTVRDTDGDPVPEVKVRLNSAYQAVTDAQGAFTMTGYDPGTYGVTVEAGDNQLCGDETTPCTPATITVPGAGTAGVQILIPRVGSLSGTLALPDGVSIDWGEISLRDATGHLVAEHAFSGAAPYSLGRFPFGTYELVAEADGLATFRASVTISGDITQNIALISGFSISGEVRIPVGVDSVEVVALDASGRRVAYDWVDAGSGAPAYVLSQLPPGDYRVGVNYDDSRWEWYPSGTDPRTATPVEVVGNSVTGINITLPTDKGLLRVSGRVALPTGIAASSAAGLNLWLENDATGHVYEPEIAADGAYSVEVVSGDYRLHLDGDNQLMTTAVDEVLAVTGPLNHDVQVPLGGMLTGRLVDADGLAVDGRVSGGSDDSEGDTDARGYWTIGPVAPGRITLQIAADGFVSAAAGPYTVVAGQSVDSGVQRFAASGRLPVRIPEVGSSVVTVLVTDLVGTTLASENIWPGNTGWIDGLPAGQVLVRFSGRQIVTEWWRDASSRAAGTVVSITASASAPMLVPDLAVAAPALGTITGKITNSTLLTGDMRVNVYGDKDVATAAVSPDGTYSVQVPAGSYQVRASVCGGYWAGESGCMGDQAVLWYPSSNAVTAEWIDVASARTTANVNIELGGPVPFLASPKPIITGAVVVGSTLLAAPGAWAPAADHLAYRWNRADAPIDAATASTYALTAADLGEPITVTVTATSAGRLTTTRTSAPTVSVAGGLITAGLVSVRGALMVGSTLTLVPGTWLPGGTTFGYQWLRDGGRIAGATSSGYTVQPADVARRLSVTVTGTKPGYIPEAVTSAATASVPDLVVPVLTSAPTPRISGTVKVGSILTVEAGAWAPAPVTLTYQWLRDGAAIGGANRQSYTLSGSDLAKAISVRVTGSKAGYVSVQRTSAPTAKVASSTMRTVVPTISGTLRVGAQLTAKTTGWVPGDARFGYRWLRSGKTIRGATAVSYTLSSKDLGKTIKVTVTGSGTGYPSASVTSKATRKVGKGSIVATTPKIAGIAQVGMKLSVPPITWQPAGTKVSYQWYRSGRKISHAKSATYTPKASDLGRKLTVRVTGSKTAYTSASKTSGATAAVAPGVLLADTPAITGRARIGQVLKAKPGTWKPTPVSLSYQWLRGGVAIVRATHSTYKPAAADLGATITVRVSGRRSGYTTVAVTSAPTVAIAAG
ncbi:MAG: carboxypeptidase regulatory-like domain-containing protein [Propionicimonas sp.]